LISIKYPADAAFIHHAVRISPGLIATISFSILFKILSFVFLNYEYLAATLSYLSIGSLLIVYLFGIKYFASDLRGIIIALSFVLLLTLAYLHSLLIGVASERALAVLVPILLSVFYILPIRALPLHNLDNLLSLTGFALLIKLALGLGITVLLFLGYLSADKESLQFYYGKMADDIVSYDSFAMFKLYEKSLVILPLALYLRPQSMLLRVVQIGLLVLGCLASLTVSFYVTLLMVGFVFLYRDLHSRRYFNFLVAVIITAVLFYYFVGEAKLFFMEKTNSILIKANQWNNLFAFDSFFGVGVGSSNVPTLQAGDIFIENSYILLYYWFGFFATVFFLLIYFTLFIAIANLKRTEKNAVCAITIASILINSGSNAYLFSGGVLLILFICLNRFDMNWRL